MSYHDLKMRCPKLECGGGSISSWSHYCCEGVLQIAESGNLRCKKCYSCHIFWDWRFACGNHPGEFRKPDFDAVLNNFIALSSYYPIAGIKWIKELTNNLADNWMESKP